MALAKLGLSTCLRALSTRLQPLLQNAGASSKWLLGNSVVKCTCNRFLPSIQVSAFHTSIRRQDLSEFFDEKMNWGEEHVRVGRPWTKDELRIKSNEDLHKLWYVLLKERNMLLTMEAEYNRQVELFPSPERLDKVDESMVNLLAVVRERNIAYNLLETGKTGEPEGGYRRNYLGLKVYKKFREHLVPKKKNRTHRLLEPPYRKSMMKYIMLYKEKLRIERRQERRRERNINRKLIAKFPHLRDRE